MKAISLSSQNWVLTKYEPTKYVNKDVFGNPKGEGKRLHLSLFRNDYPVTIPQKLKRSFFSLKVNKWQEWDLQPGFSVPQFPSTNHSTPLGSYPLNRLLNFVLFITKSLKF